MGEFNEEEASGRGDAVIEPLQPVNMYRNNFTDPSFF